MPADKNLFLPGSTRRAARTVESTKAFNDHQPAYRGRGSDEMGKPKFKFVKDDVRDLVIEECAKAVPTSWLDPMMTGPNSVKGNFDGPSTERLLQAVAERIRSLKSRHQ
jgi:hypothetical protein